MGSLTGFRQRDPFSDAITFRHCPSKKTVPGYAVIENLIPVSGKLTFQKFTAWVDVVSASEPAPMCSWFFGLAKQSSTDSITEYANGAPSVSTQQRGKQLQQAVDAIPQTWPQSLT